MVSAGSHTRIITIREADIRGEDQTASEKNFVEIMTKAADGIVVADAVLYVP